MINNKNANLSNRQCDVSKKKIMLKNKYNIRINAKA